MDVTVEIRYYHEDRYGRRMYRTLDGTLQHDPKGEIRVSPEIRAIAAEWHGGGGSALYSLSSMGSIASEIHRMALLREIRQCSAAAAPYAKRALNKLQRLVEGVRFHDSDTAA